MDRKPAVVGVSARLLSPVIGAAVLSIVLGFATSARSAPFVEVSLSGGAAAMELSGNVLGSNSQSPQLTRRYWQGLTNTWSLGNNDFVTHVGARFGGFAPLRHRYAFRHHPDGPSHPPDNGGGGVIPTPEPGAAVCFAVGFLLVASQLRGRAKSRS